MFDVTKRPEGEVAALSGWADSTELKEALLKHRSTPEYEVIPEDMLTVYFDFYSKVKESLMFVASLQEGIRANNMHYLIFTYGLDLKTTDYKRYTLYIHGSCLTFITDI